MNRRSFLQTSAFATAASFVSASAFAAHDGKVGKIDAAEWTKLNLEAGEKLKAIKPTADKLSEADQELIKEIALGGMLQLELSRAALAKAKNPDVKLYAQAEVDEQTGLAKKLQEIAAAKGTSLPGSLEEKDKKSLDAFNSKAESKSDHEYLQEGGIDGHERLEKTMTKVQSQAADAALKEVAATALPLIKTHLQAARDEIKDKA